MHHTARFSLFATVDSVSFFSRNFDLGLENFRAFKWRRNQVSMCSTAGVVAFTKLLSSPCSLAAIHSISSPILGLAFGAATA